MNILFVGESHSGSRSPQRLRALKALGYQVHLVSTTPDGHSYEQAPSFADRIAYRLRMPWDTAGVNTRLQALDASSFDLALFDNARTVRKSTLAALKAGNPALRLVWFCEDDMMNPRHRTRWVEGAIPLFDLWVTTKSFNADPDEIPRLGVRRILFVNNSYDPELHRPVAVTPDEQRRFGADVSFVGTFERPRADSLFALARAGVPCRVWGNGWSTMVGLDPNLVVENRPVYGSDYARVLSASKVNLCFLRHFNRDRQTTRSVEIPAAGGFMLHEQSDEMKALLRPDMEADYFGTDAELVAKCRRWLADDRTRHAVARLSLVRVESLGLSHEKTLARIIDYAQACA